MDNDIYKAVRYDLYCGSCKYEKRQENQLPCCDCLDEPLKEYSEIPVKYEAKEKTK